MNPPAASHHSSRALTHCPDNQSPRQEKPVFDLLHPVTMHLSLRRLSRKPSEQLRSFKSDPIPPGEIDAGNATEKSLDTTDILNRSRLVTTSMARMPYIGLRGKYNRRWYVDAVTLPHNSVRTLLSKLFAIVTTVKRLALDMTESDFQKLFAFSKQFQHYVTVLLEADEKILYPTVEGSLRRLPDYNPAYALHPTNRAATVRELKLQMANIQSIEHKRESNVEKVACLQTCVDAFASQLMEYYNKKERAIPGIVETSVRGSRERTRLERHLLKFFATLGLEFRFAVLLAAPLQTEEVRVQFLNRHFSTAKKKLFKEAEEHVDESFFEVAKAFERAADKYEARFSMNEFLTRYGQVEEEEEELDFDDDDFEQVDDRRARTGGWHDDIDDDEAEDEDEDDDHNANSGNGGPSSVIVDNDHNANGGNSGRSSFIVDNDHNDNSVDNADNLIEVRVD